MNDEVISKVYNLKQKRDLLQKEVDELNEQIKDIETQIDEATPGILEDILKEGIQQYKLKDEDIVVTLCHNTTTSYKDEDSVLNYLLKNYPSLVKISYKIDKKGTNKELKTNMSLKEGLNNLTETKTTQYVVITNSENTEKMLQHMLEGKEK